MRIIENTRRTLSRHDDTPPRPQAEHYYGKNIIIKMKEWRGKESREECTIKRIKKAERHDISAGASSKLEAPLILPMRYMPTNDLRASLGCSRRVCTQYKVVCIIPSVAARVNHRRGGEGGTCTNIMFNLIYRRYCKAQ